MQAWAFMRQSTPFSNPTNLTFAPHCIESQQHGRSLPGSLQRLDDTRKDGLSSLVIGVTAFRVPEGENPRIQSPNLRETNRPDLPLGSPGVPKSVAWLRLNARLVGTTRGGERPSIFTHGDWFAGNDTGGSQLRSLPYSSPSVKVKST